MSQRLVMLSLIVGLIAVLVVVAVSSMGLLKVNKGDRSSSSLQTPIPLTQGDSIEEIEQDLQKASLVNNEEDISSLESDASNL